VALPAAAHPRSSTAEVRYTRKKADQRGPIFSRSITSLFGAFCTNAFPGSGNHRTSRANLSFLVPSFSTWLACRLPGHRGSKILRIGLRWPFGGPISSEPSFFIPSARRKPYGGCRNLKPGRTARLVRVRRTSSFPTPDQLWLCSHTFHARARRARPH